MSKVEITEIFRDKDNEVMIFLAQLTDDFPSVGVALHFDTSEDYEDFRKSLPPFVELKELSSKKRSKKVAK